MIVSFLYQIRKNNGIIELIFLSFYKIHFLAPTSNNMQTSTILRYNSISGLTGRRICRTRLWLQLLLVFLVENRIICVKNLSQHFGKLSSIEKFGCSSWSISLTDWPPANLNLYLPSWHPLVNWIAKYNFKDAVCLRDRGRPSCQQTKQPSSTLQEKQSVH